MENSREFRTPSFFKKLSRWQCLWAFATILKFRSKPCALRSQPFDLAGTMRGLLAISFAKGVQNFLANLGQGPAKNTAGAVFQKLSHPVLNCREKIRPARPRHKMALRISRLANISERSSNPHPRSCGPQCSLMNSPERAPNSSPSTNTAGTASANSEP